MIETEIIRIPRSATVPQLGIFCIEGNPQFLTLELPWRGNETNISCIPEGEYTCKRAKNRTTMGGKLIPDTFEVTNVVGRSGILFHVANSVKDLRGCIGIGQTILDSDYIAGSQDAFADFVKAFTGIQEFKLNITRAHKLI